MADDLDDDWWTEVIPEPQQVTQENNQRKRKIAEVCEQAAQTKKKKKRKRKTDRGAKMMVEKGNVILKCQTLWNFFKNEKTGKLSPLEFNEIRPTSDDWFLDCDEKFEDLSGLSLYLKHVIPNWNREMYKIKDRHLGTPLLLIITSSARRAVNINRSSASFKGPDCMTAKLFGKHFTVEQHEAYLKKNMVHLAVGTPGRVIKLIKGGSLSLEKLRYVIIDWSWRDVKERSLVDIPEVKNDLLQLLEEAVFPAVRNEKLKIGLF